MMTRTVAKAMNKSPNGAQPQSQVQASAPARTQEAALAENKNMF